MARSKSRLGAQQARAARALEKYERFPMVDVLVRVYRRDRESAGTVVGSAIAFRLFLFFVPLLLFVVGLAGFVATVTEPEDVSEATGVTGTIAAQIETALTQPNSTRWVAVAVGLVGMITTGRTLSKVLMSASSLAWRLPVHPKASVRVVGAVVGLIVGVGLVSIIVNRVRSNVGIGVTSVSFLLAFALYVVAWVALHALLPRATRDVGSVVPGAVLLATVLVGMQAFSQLYLPDRFGRASELYGAIGVTIVTLGWFFIVGRAIVLALALDAVIDERFGSITRFVFALPVLRTLARHSKLVRRVFGLEE